MQIIGWDRDRQRAKPIPCELVAWNFVRAGTAERAADEMELVETQERVFESITEVQDEEGEQEIGSELEK